MTRQCKRKDTPTKGSTRSFNGRKGERWKNDRNKTRTFVPQPSIPDAYLIRPNVGYMELSNGFNYTTYDELNVAYRDLQERG